MTNLAAIQNMTDEQIVVENRRLGRKLVKHFAITLAAVVTINAAINHITSDKDDEKDN